MSLQRPALALALAVGLLAAGCSAPAASSAVDPAGQEALRVVIRGLDYAPATLAIAAGTTVTWVNEDVAAHDVTADDGTFASPTLQEGDTFVVTFDTPGSWAYHCRIHPEMIGLVTVR